MHSPSLYLVPKVMNGFFHLLIVEHKIYRDNIEIFVREIRKLPSNVGTIKPKQKRIYVTSKELEMVIKKFLANVFANNSNSTQ